ncbi:MAG TPA: DsrE family protein [Burkholderiaceae bacterium]|nr:DsrE family protein [Burkholderiaceae bacterium]
MQRRRWLAAAAAITVAATGCAAIGSPQAGSGSRQDKVVYHINEGIEQASNGLRNANNHLSVDSAAKIVFVTHARGVDFLITGARDRNGNLYEPMIDNLKLRGVQFEVCEITLQNRNLKKEQFIGSASYVPSGVGELTRLQQREGFAYIKP